MLLFLCLAVKNFSNKLPHHLRYLWYRLLASENWEKMSNTNSRYSIGSNSSPNLAVRQSISYGVHFLSSLGESARS